MRTAGRWFAVRSGLTSKDRGPGAEPSRVPLPKSNPMQRPRAGCWLGYIGGLILVTKTDRPRRLTTEDTPRIVAASRTPNSSVPAMDTAQLARRLVQHG